jgi:peptidylprolyl isomerase
VKFLAPFAGALLASIALVACGGGAEGSSAADKPRLKMSAAEIARLPKVKIAGLRGPRPHKLVIRDLRRGSGAVVKRGDTTLLAWVETPYGTAFETTPSSPARQLEFSFGTYIKGWEQGLPGMKVGGRRELIVPTRLGDTGQTTVYVIDMLGIKRN